MGHYTQLITLVSNIMVIIPKLIPFPHDRGHCVHLSTNTTTQACPGPRNPAILAETHLARCVCRVGLCPPLSPAFLPLVSSETSVRCSLPAGVQSVTRASGFSWMSVLSLVLNANKPGPHLTKPGKLPRLLTQLLNPSLGVNLVARKINSRHLRHHPVRPFQEPLMTFWTTSHQFQFLGSII